MQTSRRDSIYQLSIMGEPVLDQSWFSGGVLRCDRDGSMDASTPPSRRDCFCWVSVGRQHRDPEQPRAGIRAARLSVFEPLRTL